MSSNKVLRNPWGKIASITGDAATDGICIGFIYEPKVPKELLVNKALNN